MGALRELVAERVDDLKDDIKSQRSHIQAAIMERTNPAGASVGNLYEESYQPGRESMDAEHRAIPEVVEALEIHRLMNTPIKPFDSEAARAGPDPGLALEVEKMNSKEFARLLALTEAEAKVRGLG